MRSSSRNQYRQLVPALAIAVLLLTLHFYHPPRLGLWTLVFFNSLHVPVFGLIAIAAFALLPDSLSRWRRMVLAFLATAALGVLSEAAQIFTSRDASLEDLLADCLGAAGFLAALAALQPASPKSAGRRWLSGILAAVLLGWALWPLVTVSAAYLERNAVQPDLVSFDSRFGMTFTRRQNIDYALVADDAGTHAQITLGEGPWPGVSYHDLYPDWTGYTRLSVEIGIEGDVPLDVGLRVHDAAHRDNPVFTDRFNRTYTLEPGRHGLQIPIDEIRNAPRGRQMDMERIAELIVFSTNDNAGRTLRLFSIRLE